MNVVPLVLRRALAPAFILPALFVVAASCGLFSGSAAAEQPLGAAFTYQGRLQTGGGPAAGSHDFEFGLYDAPDGGNQVGATTVSLTASVSEGLFSAPLDFGAGAFDGNRRWLEIGVRPAGSGDYRTLTPRSEVSAAPYAGFALGADVANSATTATVALTALSATTAGTAAHALAADTATTAAVALTADTAAALGAYPASAYTPFRWETISTNTQAQGNRGYLTSGLDTVQVTLPVSPAVGEVVRLSGIGADGWRVAQNAGQTILARDLEIPVPQSAWTPRASNRYWPSVASSADGTRLVACTYGEQIYTSTDAGVSWTARGSYRNWSSVASSADGTRLVACVWNGQIYTSIDAGENWTARGSYQSWQSVASSADGTRLVACVYSGQIYTSADAGETWTARDSSRQWRSVASSVDGIRLVACVRGGQIYTSTDAGENWTAHLTDSTRQWQSVASSADGTRLVACVDLGQIYTSTDAGVSWTARDSNRRWWSVASSADGTRLVACDVNGQIYTSTDAGVSWTARDSIRRWYSVASSADGTRLVACVYPGQIYTSTASSLQQTAAGISGSLSGVQNSAVELQYIGNGTFLPLSFIGALGGQ